jgi:hypothetical protein
MPNSFWLLFFMPLSVYAPFPFGQYLILPNYFVSFRLCPFPLCHFLVLNKLNYASFRLCPFPLCPFPVLNKLNDASILYSSFRFCPFPFMLLSVYAPFRINGNSRLCRIPLCQLPASPKSLHRVTQKVTHEARPQVKFEK